MSEIKAGRLCRDLPASEILVTRDAGKPTALAFPASSETPVDRWFGTEVLAHDDSSIRMDRLTRGAVPLLFNHDWADPIGLVDAGHVSGGRLMVDAHLFDTARAQEVGTMIAGGLRNVSIGYQLHTIEEQKKDNVYRATDWEPLEVSIVTVPADPSVGIGRSEDAAAMPVRVIAAGSTTAAPAEPKGAIMAEVKEAPAAPQTVVTEPEYKDIAPEQYEKDRKAALWNIVRMMDLDERIGHAWIARGTSATKASEEALKIKAERADSTSQAFVDLDHKEVRQYSVMRAIRALASGNRKDAGLEFEASDAIAKKLNRIGQTDTSFFVPLEIQSRQLDPRVLRRDATVSGSAAYLVATDNVGFIDLLRNRMVAFQMGATRLSGLVGNVTIPKQTVGATAYWLATETTAITEGNQTFVQVGLTPNTVAAYTQISRLLQLQSSPDIDTLVMSDLAKQVAIAADLAVIAGTGTEQPTGITQTGSIGTVTGTSFTYATILEFQSDVAASNALTGTCGYVTTPLIASYAMSRPTFTNGVNAIWTGSMLDGMMGGFKAMSSMQVPTAGMLFGDWASVVVGEWGVLEIAVNPNDVFSQGLTGIRAMYTMDVAVRYAGAWSWGASMT